MAGLGDNLSALGGSLFQHGLDIHKQDLLTKLEKEKEERAEQRLKDKEERERNSYGETRPEQLSNGSWVMQDYTKGGQKMGEPKPAPLNIVEELTTQQKANRASLESTVLGNTEKRFNVDHLGADRDLKVRDTESQIAYRAGSLANEAARERRIARGALEKEVAPSFYDAVDQLIKDSADLRKQYTTPDDDNYAPLTASQYREAVEESVRAAAQRGLDARAVLRGTLERMKKNPKE